MKPPRHPLAVALLWLPAWLYAGSMRLRNRYYDNPDNRLSVDLPVISIGNLTWGGTGKTPIVAWLARYLVEKGHKPAIVSRGYGGQAGRGPLTVSRGQGPLCSAEICGDEPFWLAKTLAGVSIYCGSDRQAGATAARVAGDDVVILDDGFQHRRLSRDLDIVLVDSSQPFGNAKLIPAGVLREPLYGLARADVILLTRSTAGDTHAQLEGTIRRFNADVPILLSGHRAAGFIDLRGTETVRPSRAVAFCGIGNPERFRQDLQALGIEIVSFHARRDHQRYSVEEIDTLARLASQSGATLVTTEKDLARLSGLDIDEKTALLAFRIEAEIFEPQPLIAALSTILKEVSP
jgi:tetraacyldisaccharide 4'-kinase